MFRREYLGRVAALGGVVTVAGCTEQALEDAEQQPPVFDAIYDEAEVPLPVERTFDVVADGIERADRASFDDAEEFEAHLEDADLAVEHVEEVDGLLELEYVPGDAIGEGAARSVGIVVGGFAAFVRGGFEGDSLEASILDPNGRQFGAFEVHTAWAEAYDEGEESAETFGGEVLHTLETKREASDDTSGADLS